MILLLGMMIWKPVRVLAAAHPVNVRILQLDAEGDITDFYPDDVYEEDEDEEPGYFSGAGGTVKVSALSAQKGQKITVDASPYAGGNRLRYLTVGPTYSIRVGSEYSGLATRTDIMSAGSFTMPDEPVLVEAVFQRVLPDEPRLISVSVSTFDENGKLISEKGGTATADKTEARPGETVHINAVPADGFVLNAITWGKGTVPGKLITETGTFTMWDDANDVHVDVEFEKKPAAKVSLSGAKVTGISSKVWTGSRIVQSPVVTLSGKKLTAGTDYTAACKNNVNVGKATVTITGKGNYTGTISKSFRICPRGTVITGVRSRKGKLQVTWRRQAAKMSKTRITGYQLQISTSRKFLKNKKTFKIKGYNKTSKTIGSLQLNRKYYLRIRTYKKVNRVTYYSPWSGIENRKNL